MARAGLLTQNMAKNRLVDQNNNIFEAREPIVHDGGTAMMVKKTAMYLALLFMLCLWAGDARGQDSEPAADRSEDRRALVLDVQGPIGPATRDFIARSLEKAPGMNAAIVIIRLDTPGGLDASTRDIVKAILNAPVPVATYVAPEGARAASAGTYILLASHIAAMSPATNVGAATPVAIIGGQPGPGKRSPLDRGDDSAAGDEEAAEADGTGDKAAEPPPEDTMSRKAVNDAVAYIRGLAELRGRNADWAEKAVREADSITSEKALELGVIDRIANSIGDLLKQVDGMTVEVNDREQVLETDGLVTERLEPDWRSELLAVITSPTIAYLLLLVGVYGLILEGYNPGAVLPGVVGAICLLMALYAFQMLPVNYAGLALIVLGIILMIAEVMAPSFGALGIGGIISMVIGSIILIDTDVPGYSVSRSLIGSIAVAGSLGVMAIVWFAVRARQRPVVSGREQLVGAVGTALESFEHAGEVFVHSERWRAVCDEPVTKNQEIVVTGIDGLVLRIRPATHGIQEQENV
jgi:membrane-bound serine protease (ClpP class)